MGGQPSRPDIHTCPGGCVKARVNFAPAPSKLPLTDTMVAVESGARRLSPEDADNLCGWVCGILRCAKVPRTRCLNRCNISFTKSQVEDSLELSFRYDMLIIKQ